MITRCKHYLALRVGCLSHRHSAAPMQIMLRTLVLRRAKEMLLNIAEIRMLKDTGSPGPVFQLLVAQWKRERGQAFIASAISRGE